MPLRFHLPALAEANPDRPKLDLPVGPEDPNVSLDAAYILLEQAGPLLRALLFAGYELASVEIASSTGGAPPAWTVVDLPTMEISALPGGAYPWPGGAKLAVRVNVRERHSLTQQSFAIGLNLSGGALGGAAPGEQRTLAYSTSHPASDWNALTGALTVLNFDDEVETIAQALANRWGQASDFQGLNPFTSSQPGLLWMFHPEHWLREVSETPPKDFLHDEARAAVALITTNALAFFRRQLGRNTYSWEKREASTEGVSARATRFRSYLFFAALADLNRKQGSPISDAWYKNLAGSPEIGHPSLVRYCDVLLHIAEAKIYPFPALVDSDIPSHYDFLDPLEAWLLQDGGKEIGVAIRVYGSEPMELLKAIDIGYTARECFTWEYRDPDETGMATLIVVAGPGVWIDGSHHIEALANCRLRIYRVQDPDLIPAWGEAVHEWLLWAAHDHEAFYRNLPPADDTPASEDDPDLPATTPAAGYSIAAFRVQQRPDGVRINYPALKGDDEAELIIDLQVDPTSPFQRFCYDFQPGEGQMGDRQRQVVRVWATEGVEVKVVHDFAMGVAVDEHYWRLREPPTPPGGQFDGRTLREMPPPGVPLPVDQPPNRLNPEMLEKGDVDYDRSHLPAVQHWVGISKFSVQLAADVAIGLTPIGDAVDAAEFALSFLTGTDKWGNPVNNLDRALMFGGMVLPFVSSGALRALGRGARGAL